MCSKQHRASGGAKTPRFKKINVRCSLDNILDDNGFNNPHTIHALNVQKQFLLSKKLIFKPMRFRTAKYWYADAVRLQNFFLI